MSLSNADISKTFLLSTAAEGLSWSQALDDGRRLYTGHREHFLKYIKHPEALVELSIDPLTDDPNSPWNTVRQDEIVRAEIQQDVQRLPDEASYHEDETQAMILDILFMYCKLNPDRGGYRQGMHELLAPILHVIQDDALDPATIPADASLDDSLIKTLDASFAEHDAFILFSRLMQHAQSFYEVKESTATSDSHLRSSRFLEQSSAIVERSKFIHEVCLQKVDAELAAHLTNIEILPQIFLIRWVRLLFSREFPFEQFLILWDTIFAVDSSLELIDLICVAMLIRIRWELLEADYSVCLQLLLKYPAPGEPHGPHTFVDDALYLREHLSSAGGASLVMKYTGKMPTVSSPSQNSRAATPSFRGFNSFRQRGSGSKSQIPSPSRFIQQQGGMEALFQGAAKGAKGVFERGERLGINQAVRDAVGEIRRNLNEARSAPRSPRQVLNEEGPAKSLAALERRNQQLATMLDETVNNLKALSASNLDDKDKSLELIEIAAAKVQFVKIYLEDSSMEVPILEPLSPEEAPKEVVVAETTLVQPEPVPPTSAGVDISSLQIAEPSPALKDEAVPPTSPDAMDTSDDKTTTDTPATSLAVPVRPAPVPTRSTLAQSSFSWMLEPDESAPSKSSASSAKSPPPQHKKRISNSTSREKNAFLFGEVTESRNPRSSDEIFGLEPLGKAKDES
ncbi:TBC1 domain family member 5 [Fusarium albosuccineum]|uniref:TBC1 domain family member 5 n=1 Tax=Fusarium albosuccineum TaxID=1237068 RepID=A0A8H4P6I9_9HYPO|nr:TBC1 domain family member 5 [Fusarium albosuccineum]